MSKVLKTDQQFTCKCQIDIHLTKIDYNSGFPCRLSVIFKRANYKKETSKAALLEKGQAYFDETLSLKSTFDYDKKRKKFLEKDATLILQSITNKGIKIAGSTKLNLSDYINPLGYANLEKDVILPIDKCIDKNAKFYFAICITILEDNGTITSNIINEAEIPSIHTLQETTESNNKKLNKESLRIFTSPRNDYFIHNKLNTGTASTTTIDIATSNPYHSEKNQTINFSCEKSFGKHNFFDISGEHQECDFIKYKTQENKLIRSYTSDLNLLPSAPKTRDTSADQSLLRSATKTPIKHPINFKNSKELTPKISKNMSDLMRSHESEDLNTCPINFLHLKEQLETLINERDELEISPNNNTDSSRRLETKPFTIQKDTDDIEKEQEPAIKINSTICTDKRMELELKLYKEKLSSLTKINQNLKNELILIQESYQELEAINKELLIKLTGVQTNPKFNRRSFCIKGQNGEFYQDILRKMNILKASNDSLNQMIAYANFDNERLKLKNVELSLKLQAKELHPMHQQKEISLTMKNEPITLEESLTLNSEPCLALENIDPCNEIIIQDRWFYKTDAFHNYSSTEDLGFNNKKKTEDSEELANSKSFERGKDIYSFQTQNEDEEYAKKNNGNFDDDLDFIIIKEKNDNLVSHKQLYKEQEEQQNEISDDETRNSLNRYNDLMNELSAAYIKIKSMEEKIQSLNSIIVEKTTVTNHVNLMEENKLKERIVDAQIMTDQREGLNEIKKHNEDLALKLKTLEKEKELVLAEHKEKILILDDIVDTLKQQNEKYIEEVITIKTKSDTQIALIKGENEKLIKQIDDLKAIIKQCQCTINNSEKIDLKNQNQKLICSLNKAQEDVKLFKTALNQAEKDKEFLRSVITSHEEKVNAMKDQMDKLECDTWKSKHKLAKILNVAFEYGGSELMENIEQYLCNEDPAEIQNLIYQHLSLAQLELSFYSSIFHIHFQYLVSSTNVLNITLSCPSKFKFQHSKQIII